MAVDFKLNRADKTYTAGDKVGGWVTIKTQGDLSHTGIHLELEGTVTVQIPEKNLGLLDSFYSPTKTIPLVSNTVELVKPGKLSHGVTKIAFEIPLKSDQELYDSYKGLYISVRYMLNCEVRRGLMAKPLSGKVEFMLESRPKEPPAPQDLPFRMTPNPADFLKLGGEGSISIEGRLQFTVCTLGRPLEGTLVIGSCPYPVVSVEMQLFRIETIFMEGGSQHIAEVSEIQNTQVGDGDIARGLTVPLYMVFPRLFTCPTTTTRAFKIEYELVISVLLEGKKLINDTFPLVLVR